MNSVFSQKKSLLEMYNIKSMAIIITLFSLILIILSLSMIPYIPGGMSSSFPYSKYLKPSKISSLDTNQTMFTTLSKSTKNLIFIGDVHGALDELKALLLKINYDPVNDHLLFVGDLVAKGPESLKVVKFVKELGASCVRGNHDEKVLLWKKFFDELHAMDIELDDYVKANGLPHHLHLESEHLELARNLNKELYEFLISCPIVIDIPEQDLYVVHAGLLPGVPIYQQSPDDIMSMRAIKENGQPTKSKKEGISWLYHWNQWQKSSSSPKTVIYGHDASRGLNINEYSFGLDSRCVQGGELTALKWNEGKSIYNVACKRYVS